MSETNESLILLDRIGVLQRENEALREALAWLVRLCENANSGSFHNGVVAPTRAGEPVASEEGDTAEMNESWTLIEQPKFVGYYCIGGRSGLQVHLKSRPPWLHRACTRWLLGWEWVEGMAYPPPSQDSPLEKK